MDHCLLSCCKAKQQRKRLAGIGWTANGATTGFRVPFLPPFAPVYKYLQSDITSSGYATVLYLLILDMR
jgi:hypothetical protein